MALVSRGLGEGMERLVDVELKIVSEHRDGLLLALGEVLIANRFNLMRHRRANTESGVVMVLVVQGPEEGLMRLEEQLGNHWLVQSLESNAYDPNAPASMQAGAPPPVPVAPRPPEPLYAAASAAPPAATQAPKMVYDQKRIEELLPQIARDYPQVFGQVLALDRGIEPARRESTLRYVGSRVGAWVYKRDFALGARLPMSGSIRQIALPALRQILPAELEGDFIKTTSSPFANAGVAVTAPQCHFLRGFLEGALNEAGNLGVVRVSEVSCRATGGDCCKFVFHV